MPADYLSMRSDVDATRRWAKLIARLDGDGRDANGQSVRVAEVGSRVVGLLMVGPGRDPDMDGRVELMSLYVHPDRHWSCVAQGLVAHGLPDGPSYLWALDGNRRAQAFYRKLGYRLDGAATKPHEPTGSVEVRMVRP